MLIHAGYDEWYPVLEVEPADYPSSVSTPIDVPQEAYDEYKTAIEAFEKAEAKMRAIVKEARAKCAP